MKRTCFVAALSLALSAPAFAETLTLDSIIALCGTGIGDEAVIAKIKSSGTRFDLSTDQMIELKGKGVSGPVIAALLGGADSAPKPAAMSMDSPDAMVPHPSGVYLLMSMGSGARMQRIDPTVTNQSKTGGIFGYALTGGIASMSIKTAIQNETAKTRAAVNRPTFYFFFDESNPETARQITTFASGSTAAVSSPAEFRQLYTLLSSATLPYLAYGNEHHRPDLPRRSQGPRPYRGFALEWHA